MIWRAKGKTSSEPRPVETSQLTLVEQPASSHSVFEAECGKGGTYVAGVGQRYGRIRWMF